MAFPPGGWFPLRYWVSPFPLPAAIREKLSLAGLEPWPAANGSLPGSQCLLLYDSPDRLIQAAGHRTPPSPQPLTPLRLLEGYQKLLAWSEQGEHPLLGGSQLERQDPQALQAWLKHHQGAAPPSALADNGEASPIEPLLAAATLRLMEAEPPLLKAYLDLELRAMLRGHQPDLQYLQRLRQASERGGALLEALLRSLQNPGQAAEPGEPQRRELERQLAERDQALQANRKEAELNLLQLQQVQEEMERLFLLNRTRQKQIESQNAEIQRLQQNQDSLHSATRAEREGERDQLANLQQQLAAREQELKHARQNAELTLRQLQQVQEELETQFLRARAGEQLVAAQQAQLERAQGLLVRLQQGGPLPTPLRPPALAVEVLPALVSQAPGESLQTEALLRTYADSLQRANALLERMVGR